MNVISRRDSGRKVKTAMVQIQTFKFNGNGNEGKAGERSDESRIKKESKTYERPMNKSLNS